MDAVRRSHFMRMGCADQRAFRAQAGRRSRTPASALALRDIDDIPNGYALYRQLRDEYQALLTEIGRENRRVERQFRIPLAENVEFAAARDVGASVRSRGDQYWIGINCGAFLAIDDALLSACATPSFGSMRLPDGEIFDGYTIATCGPEIPTRYFDYGYTARLGDTQLASGLTNVMPLHLMRLAMVDLLHGLAVQWILFHEQAHELLGHLRWRAARFGDGASRIDEARFALDGHDGGEAFCLELQADALATHLLVADVMNRTPRSSRRFARYQRATRVRSGRCNPYALDLASNRERYRIALLAASVAPLLFELRRERTRVEGSSHPPPATRLLNIFLTAISTWANAIERNQLVPVEPGPFDIDILKPALSASVQTFVDLEILARVIRLQSPLYLSAAFEENAGPVTNDEALSPLAKDLIQLVFESVREANVTTPGGRHYLALRDRMDTYSRELLPYARVYFTPHGDAETGSS